MIASRAAHYRSPPAEQGGGLLVEGNRLNLEHAVWKIRCGGATLLAGTFAKRMCEVVGFPGSSWRLTREQVTLSRQSKRAGSRDDGHWLLVDRSSACTRRKRVVVDHQLVPELDRSRDVVASLAVTIDGYIARSGGAVDYLDKYPLEEFGFEEWVERVGAFVMGSTTYEPMADGDWMWGDRPTLVLTSRSDLPTPEGADITFSSAPTAEAIAEFRKRGDISGRIWLFGGGRVITDALNGGVVDTLDVTLIPEALGDGIPLFTDEFNGPLRPLEAVTYASGAVRLVFDSSPDGLRK